MLSIPKNIKRKVFKALVDGDVIYGIHERDELEELVVRIAGTDSLGSDAPIFSTFTEDFRQHCLRDYDWTDEYLFVERLKILDSDSVFRSFVEAMVSPDIQESESDINEVVSLINQQLETSTALLVLLKYDSSGLPVYQLVGRDETSRQLRPSRKLRKFTFLVDKYRKWRSDSVGNHRYPSPEEKPCFVLVNDRWNNYRVCSLFNLFWYSKNGYGILIGAVNIIHKTEYTEKQMENGRRYDTCDYIPDSFQSLEGEIASLGQGQSYYDVLKSLFPDCYEDVLWGLQDCAIFPVVEENFLEHKQFNSLIRFDSDKLLREEKFLIKGLDVRRRYHFSYEFTPKYSELPFSLDFQFGQEGLFPHRLYALIGENGTGKTQFLSALPISYSQRELTCFKPYRPIFSKIITVSMSMFDDIAEPVTDESFIYAFCGFRLDEFCGGKSKSEVVLSHLLNSIKEIEKHDRTESAKEVLRNMLPESILNELFVVNDDGTVNFCRNSLKEIVRKDKFWRDQSADYIL